MLLVLFSNLLLQTRERRQYFTQGLSYGVYATSNNISVISLQLVLFVEETRVPGENHSVLGYGGSAVTVCSFNQCILSRGQVTLVYNFQRNYCTRLFFHANPNHNPNWKFYTPK